MADYNINAITRRVVFTGSAGLGPYAFSFEILANTDIVAYFNATKLTLTTDFTVTINANGTGSVNIVTGSSVPSTPTASDTIIIIGARDIERVTDFVTAGDLLASSLNEQLDALTIFDQQLAEEGQRSMRAPVYDPALVADGGVVDMTLPAKADRAGRFLAFDTNGNPTATTNVGDFKGDWAASTTYRIGDLVKDTTDDSIYRVNVDHTSSGSLPLSTNTNAAFYDLFVDLSDINASEAAAAASASAAASSASAASTSETNAAASASTASTQATNAASSATSSASSATASQTAQAAAEAALDTFDDRFLGAKASDPSVDNDGNALQDGAIYYNTTDEIMKVYDLTNTIWRNLALTGTDQTNVNLVAGQISPTNNIATVAGISADITTTATNNANITTVATSIADVNAVGADIANVTTVATNLTDINAFADTYFISATAPASPTLGDLWFDTTNDIMKVYSASGFVNAGSSVNGTANRYVYTATSGQTTFAATYDAGYIDVYLNGVKLQSGTDFTATDGANVVLTVGAALNDQIDIVAYGTFNIAIPDISGDATPTLGGDLATSGNDITFGDNDKAVFGAGSDLQIYHDGSNSYITDSGDGSLYLRGSNQVRIESATGEKYFIANANADTNLYYDNSVKLATTATGVDVTGTIKAKGGSVSTQTTNAGLIANSSGKFVVNHGNEYGLYTGYINSTNDAIGIASTTNAGVAGPLVLQPFGGNVGIGTSSPTASLTVGAASNEGTLRIGDNGTYYGEIKRINASDELRIGHYGGSQNLTFHTVNAEAMRLDATGKLFKGRTTTFGGTNIADEGAEFSAIGNAVLGIGRGSADLGACVRFFSVPASGTGTIVGSISITASSTAYNTSSDYRLKENVVADWDATTRLKQLNPVRFNFIADADTTVDGFLAHEVQDVVPEAISGTHNGMRDEEYEVSAATGDIYTPATEAVLDEDGNEVTPAVAEVIHSTDVERPEELAEGQQWRETTAAVMGTRSVPDYQGIDQSKLTPLLTKALIEAVEKIEQLETRIAALENV